MTERRSDQGTVGPDVDAGRLWALVDAGIFLSGELNLDAVLHRIVETACRVIGCRYGALGVIDETGTGLSNFVFHGLTEAERERIGELPIGRGLLGALIEHPRPIRLHDLTKDPRSVGFPNNHPPMRSFLGVPILARGLVFGNLYLTEKEGGEDFTEHDERLATVLAGQAGVAVENARLYELTKASEAAARQRLKEIESVHEVGKALLEEIDPARVLRMVAMRARELVGATLVTIAMFDERGTFRVRVAVGERAGEAEGMEYSLKGTASGRAMGTGEIQLVGDAAKYPEPRGAIAERINIHSVIVAPLFDRNEAVGVLRVVHSEAGHFSDDDVYAVKPFADLASLALRNARLITAERERAHAESELAEARVREQMRAETLRKVLGAQEDERRRIARELHDSFGQALASILLGLKVIEQERTLPEAHARIADLREVAASAAGDVRRIAFELRPTALDDMGLEVALARYARDVEDRTGVRVDLSVTLGEGRLHPDVETVVYRVAQEALTNAIKSADPAKITVALNELGGTVRLIVSDDGRGFDPEGVEGRGLGLLGMSERASLVGGRLEVRSAPGRGTAVELDVPRTPPGEW